MQVRDRLKILNALVVVLLLPSISAQALTAAEFWQKMGLSEGLYQSNSKKSSGACVDGQLVLIESRPGLNLSLGGHIIASNLHQMGKVTEKAKSANCQLETEQYVLDGSLRQVVKETCEERKPPTEEREIIISKKPWGFFLQSRIKTPEGWDLIAKCYLEKQDGE